MGEILRILIQILEFIPWIIGIIILYKVFISIPYDFKEKDKQIKMLHERIKLLEKSSGISKEPIFKEEPDWLR